MSVQIELLEYNGCTTEADGVNVDDWKISTHGLLESQARSYMGDFFANNMGQLDLFKSFLLRYSLVPTFQDYLSAEEVNIERVMGCLDNDKSMEGLLGYYPDSALEAVMKLAADDYINAQQVLRRAEKIHVDQGYLPKQFFALWNKHVKVELNYPRSGIRRDAKMIIRGKDAIGAAVLSFLVLLLEGSGNICQARNSLLCEICGAALPLKTRGRKCSSCSAKAREGVDESRQLKSVLYARAVRRGLHKDDEFMAGWRAIASISELNDFAAKWGIYKPGRPGRKPRATNK